MPPPLVADEAATGANGETSRSCDTVHARNRSRATCGQWGTRDRYEVICHNRATIAAVAFAGLLVMIMRSDEVRGILTDLVRRALTVA
jgi:hypothetical protein